MVLFLLFEYLMGIEATAFAQFHLALLCFVTLVVIMILKDKATCQVLFIVSLFCAWNITLWSVEINSGVHLLKS